MGPYLSQPSRFEGSTTAQKIIPLPSGPIQNPLGHHEHLTRAPAKERRRGTDLRIRDVPRRRAGLAREPRMKEIEVAEMRAPVRAANPQGGDRRERNDDVSVSLSAQRT